MSAIDNAVITRIQGKAKNLASKQLLYNDFETQRKELDIRRLELFNKLDQETKSAVAEAYTLYGREHANFTRLKDNGVDFSQLESTFGLDFLFSVDCVRRLVKLVRCKEDFMPVLRTARVNKQNAKQWRPRHLKFELDSFRNPDVLATASPIIACSPSSVRLTATTPEPDAHNTPYSHSSVVQEEDGVPGTLDNSPLQSSMDRSASGGMRCSTMPDTLQRIDALPSTQYNNNNNNNNNNQHLTLNSSTILSPPILNPEGWATFLETDESRCSQNFDHQRCFHHEGTPYSPCETTSTGGASVAKEVATIVSQHASAYYQERAQGSADQTDSCETPVPTQLDEESRNVAFQELSSSHGLSPLIANVNDIMDWGSWAIRRRDRRMSHYEKFFVPLLYDDCWCLLLLDRTAHVCRCYNSKEFATRIEQIDGLAQIFQAIITVYIGDKVNWKVEGCQQVPCQVNPAEYGIRILITALYVISGRDIPQNYDCHMWRGLLTAMINRMDQTQENMTEMFIKSSRSPSHLPLLQSPMDLAAQTEMIISWLKARKEEASEAAVLTSRLHVMTGGQAPPQRQFRSNSASNYDVSYLARFTLELEAFLKTDLSEQLYRTKHIISQKGGSLS